MITYHQYLQFSPYFAQQDIEKGEERAEFFKLFNSLPQTVKNLLTSMNTAEKIINGGGTFGLDEFDIEAVSLAIRKIATGEIFVGNGANFIANETELPPERAKSLFSLIVKEVLAPALEDIKKIQTTRFPERFGPPPVPTQPPLQTPTKEEPAGQAPNPNVINLRNNK
jgi:hypothetical protein